jgi:hypothetical protein
VRDVTHVDPELAALVRERLDAREPRLPARFLPPPDRPRRGRVVAAVVVAFLLGLGIAMLIRPEVRSTVLSGLLGRPIVVTPVPPGGTPPAAPGAGPAGRPAASPSSSPSPSPDAAAPGSAGTPTPGSPAGLPVPTPTPGGITIQVSIPPLLPTPTPTPRPSPTPTCLIQLPPLCVRV